MKLKISSIIIFCVNSFLFAQEDIPKAELIDTVEWKIHDFYVGIGAGNICYSLECAYFVGGKVVGNKATFWGFAFSGRYEGQKEENNTLIVESPFYTTFLDFKYNSGFGINIGIDVGKRKEIDKYSTGPWDEKYIIGPYVGIGYMFHKSKIGLKVLAGTIRQISFIIDFGI